MIPLFVAIQYFTRSDHRLGLWLPLFLVWLLLLPVALLLLPFFVIGCLIARMNPWSVFKTGWQVLSGLAGTHVEVECEQRRFLVRVI
jgi:hypothetical protein